jgi:hypothetical protein
MYTGDTWYDAEGESGVQTFYCVVGDTVEICHPLFCSGATTDTTEGDSVRGFRLIHPELGELKESTGSESFNCVQYTHKKSGKQVVEFTDDLSLSRHYLVFDTVAPHSHDSMAMGGPAYATYYTETAREEINREET